MNQRIQDTSRSAPNLTHDVQTTIQELDVMSKMAQIQEEIARRSFAAGLVISVLFRLALHILRASRPLGRDSVLLNLNLNHGAQRIRR